MGMKHTPGPWCVFHMGDTIAIETGVEASGSRPNVIDWTGFDSNEQDPGTDLANARLIAAAPELLEALENITANLEHAFPALKDLGPLSQARAAITKARGAA